MALAVRLGEWLPCDGFQKSKSDVMTSDLLPEAL